MSLLIKNKWVRCILIFIIAYLLVGVWVYSTGYYTPLYPKIDLTNILSKSQLTPDDYQVLWEQTGLAAPIVDHLLEEPNGTKKLLDHQQNLFKPQRIRYSYLPPLTLQDYVGETSSNPQKVFELAPIENGYLFFTKATQTLNWRHGHAGIVIDAKRGKVLEALQPGTVSMEQNVTKWEYYPSFKMMRLKDTPQSTLDQIAQYANSSLKGLPYNIIGMKNKGESPSSTHCSLLVWQAFIPFGYDLDSNGGIFVSPQDIANSPYLETLQNVGFDPKKGW